MRQWLVGVVVLVLAVPAAARQNPPGIRWSRNVKQGVAYARQTRRPLMFWVLGSSRTRDEDLERAQRRAFSDPIVVELASRFVTLWLSRSAHRDLLAKWGLPPRANLEIVFTTPTGEKIDTLAPGGVADPAVLARKMTLVFRHYRDVLFERELRAALEDSTTPESELRAALRLIADFVILSAERAVLALLERQELSAAVRQDLYTALAALSTPACVDALLKRATADPAAAAALARCTPDAAERMLPALDGEDPELHRAVYRAVTTICGVRDVRSDRFWHGRIESLKRKEVQRVRELVIETARRWRERYAEYR